MKKVKTYKNWLQQLKNKIRRAQLKAAVAVYSALTEFYWVLGKMIAEKENVWGFKLIENISNDLKEEFSTVKGLSSRKLKYCLQFYNFYRTEYDLSSIGQQAVTQLQNVYNELVKIKQQAVAQITRWHNILIFTKSENIAEANFYIKKLLKIGLPTINELEEELKNGMD